MIFIANTSLPLVADVDGAREALRSGARGVLLRDGDPDRMASALRAAMDGLVAVDDRLSTALLVGQHDLAPLAIALTPREREVLELIAQGVANTQIAVKLVISDKTVRNHITSIFSKLRVADRSQAIIKARDAGLGKSKKAP